jgi:hypothetical protein
MFGKGFTKMKILIAFLPIAIISSIPYILKIRKDLKYGRNDMYE